MSDDQNNFIRLNKYLAGCGVASRRTADQLIINGQVKVNSEIIFRLGSKINPFTDQIFLNNQPVLPKETVYYLINKPRGVISTTADPHNRKTVLDLIDTKHRVYPVGRLDIDSEGLMLLTNDGHLTYQLTHPKFKHQKTYQVQLCQPTTPNTFHHLKQGVKLKHQFVKADSVIRIKLNSDEHWIEITLHEGQKHIVRRLLKSLNLEVLRLIRTQLGPFHITQLKGKPALQLSSKDVQKLFSNS